MSAKESENVLLVTLVTLVTKYICIPDKRVYKAIVIKQCGTGTRKNRKWKKRELRDRPMFTKEFKKKKKVKRNESQV